MTRIPSSRLLSSFAVVLTLTLVPMASARPLEAPATLDSDGGWLGSALKWVEDAVGVRRPNAHRPGSSPQASPRQDAKTSSGGSCIDPQGYPKPCPR